MKPFEQVAAEHGSTVLRFCPALLGPECGARGRQCLCPQCFARGNSVSPHCPPDGIPGGYVGGPEAKTALLRLAGSWQGKNDAMPPVLSPRPITPQDLPMLLALNNAAVPNVNALTLEQLSELVRISTVALTAEHDAEPVCLLLALAPGAPYDSTNYRWFGERSREFLYVDRIVVAPSVRSAGLGAQLHAEVYAQAIVQGLAGITCEVNLVPPNPGSYRFHARLGFSTVGRLSSADGKEVALMERPVHH